MWKTCESYVKDLWVLWEKTCESYDKDMRVICERPVSLMWKTCESYVKDLWVLRRPVSLMGKTCESYDKDLWVICERPVSLMWKTCESYVKDLWVLRRPVSLMCKYKAHVDGMGCIAVGNGPWYIWRKYEWSVMYCSRRWVLVHLLAVRNRHRITDHELINIFRRISRRMWLHCHWKVKSGQNC